MTPSATRRLLALHRWCGLVVSANVFVLALTGVILVFHDEIDDALGVVPASSEGHGSVPLSRIVEAAALSMPAAKPVYAFQDGEEFPGTVFVGMSEGERRFDAAKPVLVDARLGKVMPDVDFDNTFTGIVLKLHAQLFAGPVGSLLVGVVALAMIVSLVSGAILYGPLMKRFAFGMLRREKALRTLIADLHKLLGVATFGWTLVVAVTGLMLSVGSLLLQYYAATELAALGSGYAKAPVVTDLRSVDAAVEIAERLVPGRRWSIVALPGSDLASPRHYSVLLKGGTGVQSKMLTMTLVDALDPKHAEVHELPGYLQALLLSEPLHFGDYGGLPLKIVWTLFGIATMALSGSGVWVFASGRRSRTTRQRVEIIDDGAPQEAQAIP